MIMPTLDRDLSTYTQQQQLELTQELAQVEQTLQSALEGLQAPFSQFVIGQMRQMLPLTRVLRSS